MLTRPFYGIILGAWAFGYFPGFAYESGNHDTKVRAYRKRKLTMFKPAINTHKYYGLVWKHKFLGYSRRISWSTSEMKEALTQMALVDNKFVRTLIKFDALKSSPEGLSLTAEEQKALDLFMQEKFTFMLEAGEGFTLTPEYVIKQPIPVGIQYVPLESPVPRPRRAESKAREQLIMQEIEHELRNPIEQKLFQLASARFGKDIVLRDWRNRKIRDAWKIEFKNQLPHPESARRDEGTIPPQPSQAEVARELAAQWEEAQLAAFPQGYPDIK